jgi:nitrogen PTS system EIIA component
MLMETGARNSADNAHDQHRLTVMMLDRSFGETIRTSRLATGLSLRNMAKALKITPSYLSDIENDRRVPSEEVLQRIAQLLRVDFDHLMAIAGRFGADAERYLRRHPAAGVLFRKITERNLRDDELQKLLEEVDLFTRERGR